MKPAFLTLLAAVLASAPAPLLAENASDSGSTAAASEYLQCVPYARQISGIRIFGDAHSWWGQAEGRYARGHSPQIGAVMAFRPHRNMVLGHVAVVSRVIDSRTVLLRHANWSVINGRRGQIEDNVRAADVSAANDWSEVRVWYAPSAALGTTAWPVVGFIYPAPPAARLAANAAAPTRSGPAATRTAPTRTVPVAARQALAAAVRQTDDFAERLALDDVPADVSFATSFAGLR